MMEVDLSCGQCDTHACHLVQLVQFACKGFQKLQVATCVTRHRCAGHPWGWSRRLRRNQAPGQGTGCKIRALPVRSAMLIHLCGTFSYLLCRISLHFVALHH
jgi:hypothetical protein